MRRRLKISATIDNYLAVHRRKERTWSIALLLLLLAAGNFFGPGKADYGSDSAESGIVTISVLLLFLFASVSLIVSASRLSITSTSTGPEPETKEGSKPETEAETVRADPKTAEEALRRVRRYADVPNRWKGLYPFLW